MIITYHLVRTHMNARLSTNFKSYNYGFFFFLTFVVRPEFFSIASPKLMSMDHLLTTTVAFLLKQ